MKRILLPLLGLFAFVFVCTSCDKEEDIDPTIPVVKKGEWEVTEGETFTGRFEMSEYHLLAEVATEKGEITFLMLAFYVIEKNNDLEAYFTYGLNEEEYFEEDGHSPTTGTIVQDGRSCNYEVEIHTTSLKFTIKTPDAQGSLRTWEMHLDFVE